MSQEKRKIVITLSAGPECEKSSVGLTIANGALTSGMQVYIFLTSNAVDISRKRAIDTTQVKPFESLKGLLDDFLARGGTLWACPPCVKSRGYEDKDLIEGVTVCGASAMLELIAEGAGTLSF